MEDLYRILGVTPDATDKEIHRAYIRLIKRYHPDNKGDEERAARINHAYDVLHDPVRRKEYDYEFKKHFRDKTQNQKTYRSSTSSGSKSKDSFDSTYEEYQKAYDKFRQYQEESHRKEEEAEDFRKEYTWQGFEERRRRSEETWRSEQKTYTYEPPKDKGKASERSNQDKTESTGILGLFEKIKKVIKRIFMIFLVFDITVITLLTILPDKYARSNVSSKSNSSSASSKEKSRLEKKFDDSEKEIWEHIVSGIAASSVDEHEFASLFGTNIDKLNESGKRELTEGILNIYDVNGILPEDSYTYKKFNNVFTTKILSTEIGNKATYQLFGIEFEPLVNYYLSPQEVEYKKGYPVGDHIMDDDLNITNPNMEFDGYADIISVKKIDSKSLFIEGYAGRLDTENHIIGDKDNYEVDKKTGLYKISKIGFELKLEENYYEHDYSAFTMKSIFFE